MTEDNNSGHTNQPKPSLAAAFEGLGRLYGLDAPARFASARIIIVGLGGVGSWVAEALARSGVGRLGLVDGDDICLTNVNRQLPAMPSTVGRMKVAVIAERLRLINPALGLEVHENFLAASNLEKLIAPGCWDVVVDAIDRAKSKALLAAHCRDNGLPLVMVGAAGGRVDPVRVKATDLGKAEGDALLAPVRKILRRDHGFPRGEGAKMDIRAVWSSESAVLPDGNGGVCAAHQVESAESRRLGCETGYGSSVMVTGTFGLLAAAEAVGLLLRPCASRSQSVSGSR